MPIKLNGSSSGFTQIDAASVAGNNTLTLPTASGTLMTTGGTNTFTANQAISVTDNTNPALDITQLGTSAALRVNTTNQYNGISLVSNNRAWQVGSNSTALVTMNFQQDALAFANYGAELMRIQANGNVGIGTASPGQKLDVLSSAAAIIRVKGGSSTNQGGALYVTKAGSTSTLTAFGDRATIVGGTPDAAAGIYTDSGVPLVFDVSTTERMRIDSNGKVLVGTSSTFIGASNLQIASSLNEQIAIRSTAAASGRCWRFTADSNNTTYIINQDTVGVYIPNGNTTWSSLSDERAKDIIEPISDAASKVSTLRAVIGKYKTDEEGKRRSFLIAQDVQAVLPEAVSVADQETGYLGLSYTDTIPLLTAALQEALTKIDALEARLATLENA